MLLFPWPTRLDGTTGHQRFRQRVPDDNWPWVIRRLSVRTTDGAGVEAKPTRRKNNGGANYWNHVLLLTRARKVARVFRGRDGSGGGIDTRIEPDLGWVRTGWVSLR